MLKTEEQILSLIDKSNNILIVLPKEHNCDVICAGLSLFSFLQKLDKKIDILCDIKNAEKKLGFLSNFNNIKKGIKKDNNITINLSTANAEVGSLSYDKCDKSLKIMIESKNGYFEKEDVSVVKTYAKYDLIFTVGSPDLDSIGEIFENNANLFYNTPIVNIDNAPENENYGQINIVKISESSISEIVFSILKRDIFVKQGKIDESISEAILTGIIDRTNSFKSQTVTPKTLNNVSELISLGADREKIIKKLYQIHSVNSLRLWGRALARLREDKDNKIAWSLVTLEDFKKTNTDESHIDSVMNELMINIPEINIVIIFHQGQKNNINIILKNKSDINVISELSNFNPCGNNKIIKITMPNKQLLEAEKDIIEKLKNIEMR